MCELFHLCRVCPPATNGSRPQRNQLSLVLNCSRRMRRAYYEQQQQQRRERELRACWSHGSELL